MSPGRRLSLFTAVAIVLSVAACAPFRRGPSAGELRVRDSLAIARQRIAALDSLITPLSLAAPDSFLVAFETTRGRFDVMAHSRWAPIGVDRFYDLVHRRFYDDVFVFRVVKGFVAQFGMSGDPAVTAAWSIRQIADDRRWETNTRGRVSFASRGPHTRTTQLFVSFGDNSRLDAGPSGSFMPIGEVVSGMAVVDSMYAEYPAADQDSITRKGNEYLRRVYPKLDVIKTARIIREWRRPPDR